MSDGWISVSERLPEKGGHYLVSARQKVRRTQYDVFSELPETVNRWTDVAIRNKNGWYCTSGDTYGLYGYAYEVTHWMPLPAPPKEEA